MFSVYSADVHTLDSSARCMRRVALLPLRVRLQEYTARMVIQMLGEYECSKLEHSLYSPDLTSCDYWLFPKMKENLRGHRFELEDDIIFATKKAIRQLDVTALSKA
ncbi:histone-lysine N-methyltransferase SETMAR [Plakobranchus ocellatus]|uniref:Histone-lysine N-methyltransferase SETMAR n=1 Tax=Plakobranchus ocellatus TaxID=259542 RepID=A0AAV3YGG4_9GAST|nr:histone-lysine N-methyltransferase SETMAR [Plakobranchus ocellatus]